MFNFYAYQLRVDDKELPFYVGKGRGDRATSHLKPKGHDHKDNVIKKAYKENKTVLVEYIESNISESDAFIFEKFYISIYGRRDKGTGCLTNQTDGGEGISGYRHTKETRRLMTERLLLRHKNNIHPLLGKRFKKKPEDVAKQTGKANPAYGKHREDLANINKDPILAAQKGDKGSKTKILKNCKLYGFDSIELATNYFSVTCANIQETRPSIFTKHITKTFMSDFDLKQLPPYPITTLIDYLGIYRPKRSSPGDKSDTNLSDPSDINT